MRRGDRARMDLSAAVTCSWWVPRKSDEELAHSMFYFVEKKTIAVKLCVWKRGQTGNCECGLNKKKYYWIIIFFRFGKEEKMNGVSWGVLDYGWGV